MEPAIGVDRLRRRLGLAVVALHDVRAAGEDLAVGGDMALDARQDPADRTEPPGGRTVHGDDRARLGQAVPLVDLDPDGPEELGEVLREGCAARDGETEARAERLADLPVDEPLVEEVLEREGPARRLLLGAKSQDLFSDGDGALEKLLLRRGSRVDLVQDARVDLLVDAQHGAEDVGIHLSEVVAQLVDRLGEGDGGAAVVVAVLDEALEDVREGKEREGDGRGVERENRAAREDVGDEVALREHRPLRLAGRP